MGVGWTPFFFGLKFLQVFAVYSNGFYFSPVGSSRDTNRYINFLGDYDCSISSRWKSHLLKLWNSSDETVLPHLRFLMCFSNVVMYELCPSLACLSVSGVLCTLWCMHQSSPCLFVSAVSCHVWTLYVQFDEGRNDFDGEYDAAAITKHVRDNQLPLVVEFTQEVSTAAFSALSSSDSWQSKTITKVTM